MNIRRFENLFYMIVAIFTFCFYIINLIIPITLIKILLTPFVILTCWSCFGANLLLEELGY